MYSASSPYQSSDLIRLPAVKAVGTTTMSGITCDPVSHESLHHFRLEWRMDTSIWRRC